jgi:hypothetical protein
VLLRYEKEICARVSNDILVTVISLAPSGYVRKRQEFGSMPLKRTIQYSNVYDEYSNVYDVLCA